MLENFTKFTRPLVQKMGHFLISLNIRIIRDGHGNGNGLGFPFPFPLFPGILGMGMEIPTKALFPLFPGILGMGMSFCGNPKFPKNPNFSLIL